MTDLRTQRTTASLKEAFLYLLRDHAINEITVAAVTRRAHVGRGTFYLHYHDLYDLYDRIVEDASGDLLLLFERNYPTQPYNANSFQKLITTLTEYIINNRQVFQLLTKTQHGRDALNTLKKSFVEKDLEIEQLDKNDPTNRAELTFIVSGIIGVLTDWFDGNIDLSHHELTTLINSFVADS